MSGFGKSGHNLTIALEHRYSSVNGATKASWLAEMASTLTIR